MGMAVNTVTSDWISASVIYEGDTGFVTSDASSNRIGIATNAGAPQYWYSTVPIQSNAIANPGYTISTISTFPHADSVSGGDMWAIDIEGNLHPLGQKEIPEWDD